MLHVRIIFHKDGDFLDIIQVPWWYNIYQWLLNRLCPCCGLIGWMMNLSDSIGSLYYDAWSNLFANLDKYEKTLYKTPVDGCVAYKAIFGREGFTCWRDDCENCWHLREDAYCSQMPS